MTTGKNPLIQSNVVDTLCYVENHLSFLNDYFSAKQYDCDSNQDPNVIHGLCNTLDTSIDALRYEIERYSGKTHHFKTGCIYSYAVKWRAYCKKLLPLIKT